MSLRSRFLLLSTVFSVAFLPLAALAEDCTTTLPGANCTLDEDTTAALTMDGGDVLTVGASVDLDHTINGSDVAFGAIDTGAGLTINQNAAIGTTNVIDSLSVGAGSVWNVNSSLFTDLSGGDANDGAVQGDIDLDDGGVGATLALQDGAVVRAQIDGGGFGTVTSDGVASLSGQINEADLNVQTGILTISGSLGQATALTDFIIQDGARVNLSVGSAATDNLDLDGILSLSSNSSLVVGDYSASANGGRIIVGLDRDTGVTAAPSITFSGSGPVDLSGMEYEVAVELGSEVLVSETISDVIIGDTGATILPTLIDTSFLYDFTLVQNGNNADLDVVRGDVVGLATTGNNAAVANEIMLVLPNTTDFVAGAQIAGVQKALADASTQSEYNEILESVLPTIDAGPSVAADYVLGRTMDLAAQRILHLRQPAGGRVDPSRIEPAAGGASSGRSGLKRDLAATNIPEGGRVWGNVFASSGEQGDRDGIDGYDLDSSGIVVGVDTGRLNDKWVVGLAATYGASEFDSSNANNTQTDVKSYQLTGYATYNTDSDYFINGAVTYGIHDIQSQRSNVGSLGLQADAEYDSEQISVYGAVGADFKNGNLVVTPSLTSHFSYMETEEYRERGAEGLNLTVGEDTRYALRVGPEVTAQWLHQLDNGVRFIPELHGAYSYDVIGDDVSAYAVLEGGAGTRLQLNGFESQDHALNGGVAASFVGQQWDVKGLYDYEWNGDLGVHSVSLQGVYKF